MSLSLTATVTVRISLPSASNMREHYMERAKRVKQQRTAAYAACLSSPGMRELIGTWRTAKANRRVIVAAIGMTRIGQKKLDDDNVRGALKAIRDGIADALGTDDGSECLSWAYAQETDRIMQGVRITITINEVTQ
jgi:hypothetical protein